MKSFRLTGRYRRDYKRIAKRGYDLDQLDALLDLLVGGQPLPAVWQDHPLRGQWKGYRECHIRGDWLLIYKATEQEVLLAGTGTHSDLFGE